MDVISETKPKARKVHTCDWCMLPIEKGEVYRNCKCVNDDDIYTWKTHLSCDKIVRELGIEDWTGEGITQEQFEENVHDYVEYHLPDHSGMSWEEIMKFTKNKLGVNS